MSADSERPFVPLTRRAFLLASGALIVGVASSLDAAEAAAALSSRKPPLTPDQLDSYLAIEPDGTIVVFYGRIDGGQGLETSIAQMVAEELDVNFERVRMVMSDTSRTVNMGGASGALGVSRSGMQLRSCAAEARRLLLTIAQNALATPADRLTVIQRRKSPTRNSSAAAISTRTSIGTANTATNSSFRAAPSSKSPARSR